MNGPDEFPESCAAPSRRWSSQSPRPTRGRSAGGVPARPPRSRPPPASSVRPLTGPSHPPAARVPAPRVEQDRAVPVEPARPPFGRHRGTCARPPALCYVSAPPSSRTQAGLADPTRFAVSSAAWTAINGGPPRHGLPWRLPGRTSDGHSMAPMGSATTAARPEPRARFQLHVTQGGAMRIQLRIHGRRFGYFFLVEFSSPWRPATLHTLLPPPACEHPQPTPPPYCLTRKLRHQRGRCPVVGEPSNRSRHRASRAALLLPPSAGGHSLGWGTKKGVGGKVADAARQVMAACPFLRLRPHHTPPPPRTPCTSARTPRTAPWPTCT